MRRQPQQIDAGEFGRAARRQRAHQRAHQRGLAGAVAADQSAHLAGIEFERYVADDGDGADRDAEIGDLKHDAPSGAASLSLGPLISS